MPFLKVKNIINQYKKYPFLFTFLINTKNTNFLSILFCIKRLLKYYLFVQKIEHSFTLKMTAKQTFHKVNITKALNFWISKKNSILAVLQILCSSLNIGVFNFFKLPILKNLLPVAMSYNKTTKQVAQYQINKKVYPVQKYLKKRILSLNISAYYKYKLFYLCLLVCLQIFSNLYILYKLNIFFFSFSFCWFFFFQGFPICFFSTTFCSEKKTCFTKI